jgi:hypothetical protein
MTPTDVATATYDAIVVNLVSHMSRAMTADDMDAFDVYADHVALVQRARRAEETDPDKPGGAECHCIEHQRWAYWARSDHAV